MKTLLILSTFALICVGSSQAEKKRVVCYFASWTVYRNGNGKFDVSDIDPSLCTHINFAFVGINDDATVAELDPWESSNQYGYQGFKNLVALKEKYPDLKVGLSMGGWNEGSKVFSTILKDTVKRKIFAENVLEFLTKWGFDGFDLDWEYPGLRNGDETIDKEDFVATLKELRIALDRNNLYLSIAGGAAKKTIDIAYDVPAVTELVDMMNIMVFDFHGGFEDYVGHVSPLYPASVDYLYYDNSTFNVDYAIQYWISNGADPAKMNLGVISYGRTFTLADSSNTSLYAPASGPGKAGPYSAQEGYLGFNEICLYYEADTTYVWDTEQRVPHRYWSDQWLGFEDTTSISEKAAYAMEYELGGMMFWSFDYDDFRGDCGKGKYPLLNAINKVLYDE